MWLILALFSAVVFGMASVIMKSATLKKCSDHYILLGLYFSGTLFFLASSGGYFTFHFNYIFIFFSFLIAVGSFFGNWAVIKALELGPASLTAPMLNLNLPLFIFMSVFFYGEHLNLIKIIIIIFIIFAIVVVKLDPNENLVIKNKKWFVFVLLGSVLLFLREGGLKITLEHGINNKEVLFVSYFMCFIFSILNIILASKFKHTQEIQYTKSIVFGLVAGVCSGLGLYLYSAALIIGPASLVILIFSSRIFVIVFFSYILHKERLSFFQKCSLVSMSIGIALSGFIK